MVSVERARLSEERKDAFKALLDDRSPAVRRSLLEAFQKLGPEGLHFLQELMRSTNRMLGWQARWYLDELKFNDPVAEFKGFIRSLNYELETGVLLLHRVVQPDLDVGACCQTLDRIAARCRELIVEPCSPREKCRILNRVLFHEFEFHGNVEHYTDPRNSFLGEVLTRRTGIPISLSAIYLLVAQRCNFSLEPVGTPAHFFVGCFLDERPFFIDAFDRGNLLSPEQVFSMLRARQIDPKTTDLAPTPVREVLCRFCKNLVRHYAAANDFEMARLFAEFIEEFEAAYERHASS